MPDPDLPEGTNAWQRPGIRSIEDDEAAIGEPTKKGGKRGGDSNDGAGGDEKDDKPKKPSLFRKPIVRIGLVVVVLLLIGGGILYWLHARHYEDTDDAFVDTHMVHIAPQISGRISRVLVNDNEQVTKGQLLAEIDPADMEAKVDQLQAQRNQAETQLEQTIASKAGAEAQAEAAKRDLERYQYLLKTSPNAVAKQQADQAEATARNTAAQLKSAQAQIDGAAANIKVLDAQLAEAKLNLGYTKVVSPENGHVAQRSVALGNYVTPGEELMAIVPLKVWITANFKETQLTYMKVGQDVDVDIDACDQTIHGKIDSIQRGAGQAFGILPPENATGNFVKVVQRVPVKIILDKMPDQCPLGPGMSVEPTVTVR